MGICVYAIVCGTKPHYLHILYSRSDIGYRYHTHTYIALHMTHSLFTPLYLSMPWARFYGPTYRNNIYPAHPAPPLIVYNFVYSSVNIKYY